MIKAAAVQFQHRPGDKVYNMECIDRFCNEAARDRVDIIAFPEMCITGYWHVRHLERPDIEALAEAVPDGASSRALASLSMRCNLIVGAGLIERGEDDALYNTYVVCLPDGRVEKHRKLHCFISPHMASGGAFTVFDTHLGVKLGVLICWDNNLVENARITALRGADILLAPHQTGGTASRSPYAMGRIDPKLWHRRTRNPEAIEAEFKGDKGRGWLLRWLPSRAHDNGMFIVFANGVGVDDDEVRTGNAMIIDCYGRIMGETWRAADTMVVADIDASLLPLCTGRRWLRGRRSELYGELAQSTGGELDPRSARFSTEPTA
ncbi:MAG: nitrilase family protein [Spirochaetales bacterium]|nr:nitrilase family protein [Spirochaetales bacterium]